MIAERTVAVDRLPAGAVGAPGETAIAADVRLTLESGQARAVAPVGVRLAEDADLLQHLHPQQGAVAGDEVRLPHLAERRLLTVGAVREANLSHLRVVHPQEKRLQPV